MTHLSERRLEQLDLPGPADRRDDEDGARVQLRLTEALAELSRVVGDQDPIA